MVQDAFAAFDLDRDNAIGAEDLAQVRTKHPSLKATPFAKYSETIFQMQLFGVLRNFGNHCRYTKHSVRQ